MFLQASENMADSTGQGRQRPPREASAGRAAYLKRAYRRLRGTPPGKASGPRRHFSGISTLEEVVTPCGCGFASKLFEKGTPLSNRQMSASRVIRQSDSLEVSA
jgi:hypothetical protein